jgi:hypothetical protein
MSADNGLIVRKADGRFDVYEYNASTGSEFHLTRCRTLESAVKWSQHYQQENVVEYGISFDLPEEEGEDLQAQN